MTIATTAYKNLIGGRWVDAKSGATFDSVSPANHDDVIGTFPASAAADVDAAVAAAKAAYPAWALMPAPKRGEILFKVARILAEHKEELSRLMTREMGKVLPEARGYVQEAIDVAYYMAGEGRRLFGDRRHDLEGRHAPGTSRDQVARRRDYSKRTRNGSPVGRFIS